jgi:hypothetical protein
MTIYSVKVRYETISPMYQEEIFHFDNEVEASTFCHKAMAQGWNVGSPRVVIHEVFNCDSAMGWVLDEIAASKEAVGA